MHGDQRQHSDPAPSEVEDFHLASITSCESTLHFRYQNFSIEDRETILKACFLMCLQQSGEAFPETPSALADSRTKLLLDLNTTDNNASLHKNCVPFFKDPVLIVSNSSTSCCMQPSRAAKFDIPNSNNLKIQLMKRYLRPSFGLLLCTEQPTLLSCTGLRRWL